MTRHYNELHLTPFLSQSSELSSLDNQIKRKFSPKDGPIYQSLEKSLSDLNVVRQAYHGGSFVGNHVHKMLKVHKYNIPGNIHACTM